MDVNIVCIGKLKESYWRDACAEYAKRLSPYCKFTITELAEARLPKSPSSGEIERALEEEGARILDKCGTAFVIAMCIEGDVLSSSAARTGCRLPSRSAPTFVCRWGA